MMTTVVNRKKDDKMTDTYKLEVKNTEKCYNAGFGSYIFGDGLRMGRGIEVIKHPSQEGEPCAYEVPTNARGIPKTHSNGIVSFFGKNPWFEEVFGMGLPVLERRSEDDGDFAITYVVKNGVLASVQDDGALMRGERYGLWVPQSLHENGALGRLEEIYKESISSGRIKYFKIRDGGLVLPGKTLLQNKTR